MDYEKGNSHDSYTTVIVNVKEGEDIYTYEVHLSNKNGITVIAPDDKYRKKRASELLGCAYIVSSAMLNKDKEL